MIRHCLKIVWNRKRSNLLIAAEIFFSFLVVFGIVAMGAYYANNWRRPLGFTIDDVWAVTIDTRSGGPRGPGAVQTNVAETMQQVHAAVQEFPEVVASAVVFTVPYGHSRWVNSSTVNGRALDFGMNGVTDGFARVMGLEILRGRWFDRGDDGAAWDPVVINERLAADLYGTKDPIGRSIPQDKPEPGETQREMRVVGLIREFRQDGELAQPENYLLSRVRLDASKNAEMLSRLVLKLRPGTTAAFEERLVKRMQEVAREWSFEIKTVAEMRETSLRETLTPLAAAAIVAGFLMLMVAMGLTGVLWQTVTQRTREVGLRRAKGATIPDIRGQILGELVIVASLAILAGAAVVLQFPLLKQFGFVTGGVYATALVISAVSIYLLTLVCGWYPSRLATAVPPAEALRYE